MWATLALLTAQTGQVPPFLLIALSFGLAFIIAFGRWLAGGQGVLRHLNYPPRVWLVGVGGLFGYHFFYFLALKNAPPVEASLIAYLWPLLIVVFSALLPGERLRWWHLAGVLMGLAGTVVLVGRGGLDFQGRYALGYGAALIGALIWSSYSLLSRRFAHVSSEAVGGFCGITAVLAAFCHLALEPPLWPQGVEWLAVLGLGLGPVGASFFLWDHGVKHGDIRVLGAVSYLAPLLSTLLLVIAGLAPATWQVAAACLLITGGAVLAARSLLFSKGNSH
ncbi:MAG: EamA family transporter [Alphaproteobacteria bacterium]|nr:EamA family transporter [Alphaproteobacteria bacterium]HJP21717.1 EamA family transporter [Alphaproteobacteria bacterium]